MKPSEAQCPHLGAKYLPTKVGFSLCKRRVPGDVSQLLAKPEACKDVIRVR